MNVLYCSETWDLEKCELENEKLEVVLSAGMS